MERSRRQGSESGLRSTAGQEVNAANSPAGDPGGGAPSAKPGDTCRVGPLPCRCGLGGERCRGPELRLCPGPETPSQCVQLLSAEVTGSQHRLCHTQQVPGGQRRVTHGHHSQRLLAFVYSSGIYKSPPGYKQKPRSRAGALPGVGTRTKAQRVRPGACASCLGTNVLCSRPGASVTGRRALPHPHTWGWWVGLALSLCRGHPHSRTWRLVGLGQPWSPAESPAPSPPPGGRSETGGGGGG